MGPLKAALRWSSVERATLMEGLRVRPPALVPLLAAGNATGAAAAPTDRHTLCPYTSPDLCPPLFGLQAHKCNGCKYKGYKI